MKEIYVGLDIHTDGFYGTVTDKQGEIITKGKVNYTKEAVQNFFAGISTFRCWGILLL